MFSSPSLINQRLGSEENSVDSSTLMSEMRTLDTNHNIVRTDVSSTNQASTWTWGHQEELKDVTRIQDTGQESGPRLPSVNH